MATKKMRYFLLMALLPLSCMPKRTIYPMNESPWVALPGNQYIFEDGFLKITMVAQGLLFRYTFRNIGDRPVSIGGASILLKRDQDAIDYAPWGELVPRTTPMPDIELPVGHFVQIAYPIRVRSPFYPFRPPASPAWFLQLKATWGLEHRTYVLPFPEDLRTQGAAPETDTAPDG